jgi:hypothetical protein
MGVSFDNGHSSNFHKMSPVVRQDRDRMTTMTTGVIDLRGDVG